MQKIAGTYNENEIRFKRDYSGKQFYDVVPFRGAKESIFGKGNYLIGFGSGAVLPDLTCETATPEMLAKIVNWNKGDMIRVDGLVDGVLWGTISLKSCSMEHM